LAAIQFQEVAKVYTDGTRAVDGLDFTVADGELLVLVGPSGCGKTTALRMVAGLEEITEGVVLIGGRVVNTLPPKDRDIAMVFQNYALYPQMSVYDNMAFGLKMRRVRKAVIRRRVGEAATILGLTDTLKKKPRHLSGGQRQRVAMGRAIVREPQVFLMDEPLSNLDAKLRVELRGEIARIQRDLGVTTIYVTHDQTEAMTLGDRVAVMQKGVLQQVEAPQALYERPLNLFVAQFIGSPAMNLVRSTLHRLEDGRVGIQIGEHSVVLDETVLDDHPALVEYIGAPLAVGIRPQDLEDAALLGGRPTGQVLAVICDIREDLGSEILVYFALPGARRIESAEPESDSSEAESHTGADPAAASVTDERSASQRSMFVARVGRASRVREGEMLSLAVDTGRLHFFDLQTGMAILRDTDFQHEAS
jgi:multiple sugar transport system ATP-binding protein